MVQNFVFKRYVSQACEVERRCRGGLDIAFVFAFVFARSD